MVNLQDIASHVGVSMMTVSNALNGKKDRMSHKTYQKIMEAVEELGYIPNATARSLSSRKSKIIALWVPNYHNSNPLEIPYISYITGAISRYIHEHNYNLMLLSQSTVQEFITTIKSWNVDGAIGLAIDSKDVKIIEKSFSKPFVFIDTYTESKKVNIISTNDFEGGYVATKFLIEKGHRNIALVTGEEIYNMNALKRNGVLYNRYKGYAQALKDFDIPLTNEILFGQDISYQGGVIIGKKLGSNKDLHITAIFCTADEMAIGIKEGLEQTGLKIPDNVSIVGFDDLAISSYTTPKLTTIRQQNIAKGEKAVTTLVDSIQNNNVKIKNTILNIDLVERDSVKNLLN